MTPSLMWRHFIWRGRRVEVIQQWTNPQLFGKPSS